VGSQIPCVGIWTVRRGTLGIPTTVVRLYGTVLSCTSRTVLSQAWLAAAERELRGLRHTVGCCVPGVGIKSAGKFPVWHIPQCISD
jgi:hypothetical protein